MKIHPVQWECRERREDTRLHFHLHFTQCNAIWSNQALSVQLSQSKSHVMGSGDDNQTCHSGKFVLALCSRMQQRLITPGTPTSFSSSALQTKIKPTSLQSCLKWISVFDKRSRCWWQSLWITQGIQGVTFCGLLIVTSWYPSFQVWNNLLSLQEWWPSHREG